VTSQLRHIVLVLLVLGTSAAHAATKTSGNGNWNTAATWSPSGVPGAGDSVYVPGGSNLTLDVNGTCGAINITGNFTFPGTASRTLTISSSSGLSGNFYTSGNINGFGSASGQIIYIAGILNVSGGNFSAGTGSKFVFNGTGTKTYTNSNTIQGLEVTGSGLTLQLSSNALVSTDLTITNGTLDLGSYTANRQSSGGTLTVAAGATLKIGSTNTFPSNYSTNTLNATSTVEYSGSSQTVSNKTYGHLTLSGSGTKTMPGTSMTVAGNFTTSGTVSATAGAAIAFNGNVTIGNGTTFGGSSYTHTLKGNWTKSGTFSASTSTISCTGTSAQTINASNFSTLQISGASANVSLGGDVSCSGDFDHVSGTFNAGSYTITLSGTASAWIGGTFNAGTSTFLFTGSSQTLDAPVTLNNVTLSGTTTVTAQSGTTIGGTLTIGSGCTFSAGALSHSVNGDFSNSGTFTASTSTITLSGTSAQAIGGSSTTAFRNLTISNTSATVTANTNFSIAGTLTINANASLTPAAAVVVSGAGTLTGSGTAKVTRTSATADFSSQYTITTKTLTNLTVDYTGMAAQVVSALSYSKLTISNSSAAVTASSNFNVSSTLTVSAGATLTPSSAVVINNSAAAGTITGTGTVQVTRASGGASADFSSQYKFSTYTLTNLTVEYAGTSSHQVLDAYTYGNLKISVVSPCYVDATNNFNVTGTMTMNTNYYLWLAEGVVVNSAGAQGTFTGTSGAVCVTRILASATFAGQYKFSSINTANLEVRYQGAGAQTVDITSCADLTVMYGSGTKTLANNVTVSNSIVVDVGTLDLASYTANRSTAGGSMTVSAAATLKIGGTNTFPSNYSSVSLAGTSTVEYYGTAQTIAAQNYSNLTISGARTTSNVTLASSGTIGIAGTFTPSATFTSGGYVITGSTMDFNGTGAQTVVAFNYNNIVLSGARTTNYITVSPTGTVGIAGTVTATATFTSGGFISTNSTIDYNGSGSQTALAGPYHNLTFSNAGTKTLAAGTSTIAGTLTLSGSASANFTTNTTTIQLNGSSGQSINGAFTFYTLELSNSNGATLGANCTVNNVLTFTSGNITTGSYTLALGSSGSVSRTSGHVVGNFQKYIGTGATSKTFEIGTGSNYTPVAVAFGNVSVAGNLTATTAASDHASIASATLNPSKSVNRTWTLTNSAITFTNYSATFTFVAGDLDGGATYSNFIVGKWGGSSWSYPTVGTKTSTTTQITGVTSFSDYEIAEPAYIVSGTVFEDVNYGGGAGRDKTTSSGVNLSGVRLELFDSGGNFSTSTTSNASGSYSFSGLAVGTYYVRVVTDSVPSTRTGYSAATCKAVGTYGTHAAAGTPTPVTDYVGGIDPSTADATRALSGWVLNTSTGAFSGSGTGKANVFVAVALSTANISGIDFGFNFNAIVNRNGSGQGSFTQTVTNMNTLGGDASLAQSGLVAGKDNAVFMISNGTNSAGLRSSNNYFGGGIATITPSASFTLSTTVVLDAQKQPGWASAPIIQLNCTNVTSWIEVSGGNSTIKGFIINRVSSIGLYITTNGGNTIVGNYIGLDSAGVAASGSMASSGIYIGGTANNTIGGTAATDRNVIGGYVWDAVRINGAGATGNTVQGNYLGLNASGTTAVGGYNGVHILTSASSNTVGGSSASMKNVISGNSVSGVSIESDGNTVQGNWIGLNGAGSGYVANNEGVVILSNNNAIGGTGSNMGNVIAGNTLRNIRIGSGTGNAVLGNSIYGSGGLGIDLGSNGVLANNGTKNAGLANYDMDHPVFTSAVLANTTLTLAGYVGSAPSQSTFASARVEVFKSDNDATGYGEGQTYLGYLTADASGNISGSLTVSGLTSGDKLTGTATDGSNNTSEFGLNFAISVVFYSKGSLAVSNVSNWNTKRDGSGTDASSFGSNNSWIVQNTHTMTLSGSTNWDVSASGTVEIESGGSWTNSSSGTVTIGTLQLDNGSTCSHTTATTLPGTTKTFGATSTVNYSASADQTVASTTYGHLTINGSGTKTLAGNATVAGDLTVSAGTIDLSSYAANRSSAGGTLTVSNGATLKIGGTGTIPSNYSTHSIGSTSTIEFSGTNQSVGSLNSSQSYGHLTCSGSGTKTPAAGLTIVGNFTINSGPTFAAGSYTHTVQGNWSNGGTFTAGTSTVQFTGSSDVSITGATTFNTLTINKSSSSNTITLNNATSTATLAMTQGKMVAGSNGITITSDRTGNGIITGLITRTHTFAASTDYAFEGPYNTINFGSGGTRPSSVSVNVVLSSPGANTYMDPIDRYYDISQTGGSGYTYTLRLHYEDSEVSSPNSETSPPLNLWRRTATGPDAWNREGATSNSTTNNWVEVTGMTNVGVYSLSSRTVPNMTLILAQSVDHPSPGDPVTYTISYSNTGDGSSTTTVITASAPTHTNYVAGSTTINGSTKTDASDADEVTVSGGNISITLGTVGAGVSGTVTYRVQIN
jgi:fibronectin-binding autotransporter adhesin